MRSVAQTAVHGGVAFAACLIAIVSGCESNSADSEGLAVVVQDSAGVTILDNRSPSWSDGGAWRVSSEPMVVLGSDQSAAAEFHRVSGTLLLSDGQVVVANAGTYSVRWYGADGRRSGEVGSAGDGPGEFRSVAWIGNGEADSVYVWDSQLRRVSVLHDARFVRSFDLASLDSWPAVSVGGTLIGGHLTAVATYPPLGPGLSAGVHRTEVPTWILTPTGEVITEFAQIASRAVEYRAGAEPGMVMLGFLPFGATTLIASGGRRIILGDNAGYELEVFDDTGTLTQIVRIHAELERVEAVDLDIELERRLATAPPIEEIRDGIRADFALIPVPEFKPPYDRLLVDANENVWVQRIAATSTSGAHWDIVAPNGRWLGTLVMPAGVAIHYVGSEKIVGVQMDELGIEQVVIFDLYR